MNYLKAARDFSIVLRRSQGYVVEACEYLGLTYSEYVLLLRIYENEGCRQEDLVEMLFVDKAFVTRVIKSLEERNFVYREKDAQDRRIKRIYLTEFAKSQKRSLFHILDVWARYLVADMDEKEIEGMAKQIGYLAERAIGARFHKIIAQGKCEGGKNK